MGWDTESPEALPARHSPRLHPSPPLLLHQDRGTADASQEHSCQGQGCAPGVWGGRCWSGDPDVWFPVQLYTGPGLEGRQAGVNL